MREYQIISVDHDRIQKDIEHKVVTSQEIYQRGQKFLDALTHTAFEVLESQKIINGLPSEFLVGGERIGARALQIKKRIYRIATVTGLSDYIGNGAYYMQIPKK